MSADLRRRAFEFERRACAPLGANLVFSPYPCPPRYGPFSAGFAVTIISESFRRDDYKTHQVQYRVLRGPYPGGHRFGLHDLGHPRRRRGANRAGHRVLAPPLPRRGRIHDRKGHARHPFALFLGSFPRRLARAGRRRPCRAHRRTSCRGRDRNARDQGLRQRSRGNESARRRHGRRAHLRPGDA